MRVFHPISDLIQKWKDVECTDIQVHTEDAVKARRRGI